jgi:hypothetical protein
MSVCCAWREYASFKDERMDCLNCHEPKPSHTAAATQTANEMSLIIIAPNVERSHAGLMACECNHDGRPALAVAMC